MVGLRNRRRREVKSEINVVPFLDVLLVLLLIFMATAPIITQTVEVNLPESVESKTVSGQQTQTVIVEVAGSEFYNLVIDRNRITALAAQDVVENVLHLVQEDPKTLFLIAGGKSVPYEQVINALNLLRQAGIRSVGLMTRPI